MHLKKRDVFMLIRKVYHFLWANVVICLSSQLGKQSVGWILFLMGHQLEILLKSVTNPQCPNLENGNDNTVHNNNNGPVLGAHGESCKLV